MQKEVKSCFLLGKGRCHSPATKEGTWAYSVWKKRFSSKAKFAQCVDSFLGF